VNTNRCPIHCDILTGHDDFTISPIVLTSGFGYS